MPRNCLTFKPAEHTCLSFNSMCYKGFMGPYNSRNVSNINYIMLFQMTLQIILIILKWTQTFRHAKIMGLHLRSNTTCITNRFYKYDWYMKPDSVLLLFYYDFINGVFVSFYWDIRRRRIIFQLIIWDGRRRILICQ